MKRKPSLVDPGLLALEVKRLEYWRDTSGIEMSSLPGRLPAWLSQYPAISQAVEEVHGHSLMVNRLEAGVEVPVHADAPNGARYHLPVETNPDAFWWDEKSGLVHMAAGFWWGPVPYTIPHRVINRGSTARIHLVVDVKE